MSGKLPGLNGLRAIAASMVLVSHVYQIAGLYGDEWAAAFFREHHLLGINMVNLFFVISGFIITYILFKEKDKTRTISLKQFYIRRLLRIWPLYFGLILVVLALTHWTHVYDNFPAINGKGVFLLATFLVTFLPYVNNAQLSVLPHYWSLSVEEQFYILWPAVFKYLKGKWIYLFPCLVIITIFFVRNGVAFMNSRYPSFRGAQIFLVLDNSLFGSMSIGILGALAVVHKHPVLNFIFKPAVELLCWIIFLCTIFFSFYIPYAHFEILAIVYLVLILNVTANPKPLISLENKMLDRAGTISYGIYMYHWILIPILIVGIKKIGWWDFFVRTYQLPLLLISYALTCFIALLSYKYMESYFLRLKPAGKQVPAPEKIH